MESSRGAYMQSAPQSLSARDFSAVRSCSYTPLEKWPGIESDEANNLWDQAVLHPISLHNRMLPSFISYMFNDQGSPGACLLLEIVNIRSEDVTELLVSGFKHMAYSPYAVDGLVSPKCFLPGDTLIISKHCMSWLERVQYPEFF